MSKTKKNLTVNVLLIHSNAKDDAKYIREIRKRLRILKRNKPIVIQDINVIGVGKEPIEEIDQMIEEAHIILLLLSADLLANAYSPMQNELYFYDIAAKSVECHTDKIILPVLLRDVDLQDVQFLECVAPSIYSRKPISHYANADKVYTGIKQSVEDAVDEIRSRQSGTSVFKRFNFTDLSDGFKYVVGNERADLLANIQKIRPIVKQELKEFGVKIERETGYNLAHLDDMSNIWLNGLLIKHSIKPNIRWESILSASELYILYLASYLFPIGLCEATGTSGQPKKAQSTTPHYTEDSYAYIMSNWQELGIKQGYAEPIARLVRALGSKNLDASFEDDYNIDYQTSICLPFLARLLQLAHLLDIANVLPNMLLGTQHLPHIDKSKELWQNDPSKMALIAFKSRGDVILLRRNCSDQNIYNALINYAEELRTQVNSSLKTLTGLRKEFPIKAVINEIQPSNFPAHSIGFTLDEENIFEAFIGARLYSSKFVALREVLQNAIDACNHKQKMSPFYQPKITVTLDKDQLIVADNGLGMDADIVAHYFAKLGQSYYIHGNGKKIFNNAIAQFGVGVFSYFLIADSFQVETRKTGHQSLHFRVDKDPKIHFYFHNDTLHVQDGTKISLQLKEDLEESLDFQELVWLTKHYVPYPNVEITVKHGNKQEVIQKGSFALSREKNVLPLLKIVGRQQKELFHLIQTPIDNVNFEGNVGLIVAEEGHKQLKEYLKIYDYLVAGITNENPILVAQKGILVTEKVAFTFFKTLIGSINLKKGFPLRIHRNELNNQQHLIGILNHFQAKVIECLFDHWGDLSDKAKAKNTDALYSYINYRYGTFAKGRNERLKKAISDHFYVTVVDEDKFIYIKYAELPKHFNQLIPINTNYYKGDLRDLAKKYESPLLLMSYDHLIAELLSQDYRATAVTDETHAYGVFDLQEKKVELYPLKHKGGLLSFCVPFEQTAHLTTHIIGTPYSIFNCQHPIITWYLKQQQYLKKGRLLHQYFEQFFDILCKMNREYTGTSAQLRQNVLSELNAILKKINRQTARDKNPKIKATTFQLTAADFPAWMGAEILNV